MSSKNPNRKELQHQTLVGFLGFFAFMAVVQAGMNLFRPEPSVWPAVLALVLVLATVAAWRWGRR